MNYYKGRSIDRTSENMLHSVSYIVRDDIMSRLNSGAVMISCGEILFVKNVNQGDQEEEEQAFQEAKDFINNNPEKFSPVTEEHLSIIEEYRLERIEYLKRELRKTEEVE